ncbi:MAG: pentapeptide repeat-containing protein [Anaerolineaceae bacterium]
MTLSDPSPSEYTPDEFKKLDLRFGLVSEKRFQGCTFSKCSFNETIFQSCVFHDCTFKACDLSLAKLPGCSFKAVKFENCQLIGLDWTETAWAGGRVIFKAADFTGCVLNYSTFMGLDLKGAALRKCIAREVSFEEADLTKADCRGTDFSGSRFNHTNLTEADFTRALSYAISPADNTLKKTRFSLPEAMSLLHALDIVLTDEFGEESS